MANHLETFTVDDFRQFNSVEEKKGEDGKIEQGYEPGATFPELSRFNLSGRQADFVTCAREFFEHAFCNPPQTHGRRV